MKELLEKINEFHQEFPHGEYDRFDQDILNKRIGETWEIEEQIEEAAQHLKKGDTALCIMPADVVKKRSKIREVTVKYHGKYKNDYNDFSDFIRVSDGKYSWYQPKNKIVKK